ncbi:MAG: hypothetical protein CMK59_03455 [Proteobacteria bacterium]|nr:hypothetical protein [Pseudomonadota bacterium]
MFFLSVLACAQQELQSPQTSHLEQSISSTELSVRQAQEYQKKIIVEEFRRYNDHFQSYFLPPENILFEGKEEPWVPISSGHLCVDEKKSLKSNSQDVVVYEFANWCQRESQFRREIVHIFQGYVLQPKSCEQLCSCIDPEGKLMNAPSCLQLCQDLGTRDFCFQNQRCCEQLQRGK